MIKYNLYYGSVRLNKKMLTEDEKNKILDKSKYVKKFNYDKQEFDEIPINKIRAVKCVIV